MASLTQWTWVWVNSGSWWWTGSPGMLWSMGSQRVRHDWATELNRTDIWCSIFLSSGEATTDPLRKERWPMPEKGADFGTGMDTSSPKISISRAIFLNWVRKRLAPWQTLRTTETGIVSKTAAEAKFPSPGFLCTKFSALSSGLQQSRIGPKSWHTHPFKTFIGLAGFE